MKVNVTLGYASRQGSIEVLGQKPVTVTLFLPQISLGMTWDQTQAYMVTGPGIRPESWHGLGHGTA